MVWFAGVQGVLCAAGDYPGLLSCNAASPRLEDLLFLLSLEVLVMLLA